MKTTTSSSDRDWRPQIKSFKSFFANKQYHQKLKFMLEIQLLSSYCCLWFALICSAFEQNTQFENIPVYVSNPPIHISNSHFIPNSCLKFSCYHLVVDCNSNSFCSAFEQNTQFENIIVYVSNPPISNSQFSHFELKTGQTIPCW